MNKNYILLQGKLINLDAMDMIIQDGDWIKFKSGDRAFEFLFGLAT